MNYILIAIISLGNYFFQKLIAEKSGLIDKPDGELKNHKNPVLFHGGTFLASSYLICLGLFLGVETLTKPFNLACIFVTIMFLIAGFYDDKHRHGYNFKLAVQLALILLFLFLSRNYVQFSSVQYLFVVLFLIININSINVIDNFNGVSGSSYLYIMFTLVYTFFIDFLPNMYVLVIPLLIFLFFNLRKIGKSKIFMGNNGSYAFGFGLSAIFIYSVSDQLIEFSMKNFFLLILKAGIIFYPNFLDTLTVILIRIRNGINPLSGSNDHLSHNLISLGVPDVFVSVTILLFSLVNFCIYNLIQKNYGVMSALMFVYASLLITSLILLNYQKIRNPK